MKIKLNSLQLITYKEDKKKHFRFVKEMKNDPLMCHFVTDKPDEYLMNTKDDSDTIGSTYLVAKEKDLIGYVRFAELDKEGTLDLHYAVHPDQRRKGYGTKILIEVSDYLLKNINEVNMIQLNINNINSGSIKCAKKAAFKQEPSSINNNPVVFIKEK